MRRVCFPQALRAHFIFVALLTLFGPLPSFAAANGTIAGTVTDATGAVIAGATLTARNLAQHTTFTATSDVKGLYAFLNLPVGQYDLTASAAGFAAARYLAITVDVDASLRIDLTLPIGEHSEMVTVDADSETSVETTSTHLGEVVSAAQMTALPINGRSYTDLLANQPGVTPVSTLLPSSVIMAGVTGSISPSGDANAGNLSINGQRESSNGFLVNGIDVQEHMNGGTSVLPDLDSIEEFRVLTTSFDPEYGNYNGGIITIVSKAGGNALHGSGFEFFRNTALDAKGYFDQARAAFNQNQFGGTIGGPVHRDKLFFFADYQGTRTTQGISTQKISVPTVAERGGDFSDRAASFGSLVGACSVGVSTNCEPIAVPNTVSGPYLASQVLSPALGYTTTAGEPYYFTAGENMPVDPIQPNTVPGIYSSNCTSSSQCVFPNAVIPQSVWSAPARNLLKYIPLPNVASPTNDQFQTSSFAQTVLDDKGSLRLDGNTRLGQVSATWFVDDYSLDNPYPGSVAGATIPGFDALFTGRAQLFSLGDTSVLGSKTVNEFHMGYLRNANIIGQPRGGLGVSLASQGFVTGAGTLGIDVQAPEFEGVENIVFPTFTMGVPITNLTQVNNTIYASDGVSWTLGTHTLKVGVQLHLDQVNEHPNATFNGTFNINETETGNPYANFLIGTPSNFTQSSGRPFYLRNRYLAVYAQDSWRICSDLTISAGLRWDVIMPWWEKYNQIQTYIAGAQSTLYPGAPNGLVVAGDPGVPSTLAPTRYGNFAPRLGFAYSPTSFHRLLRSLLGHSQQSSIRASYGIFYTAFPGLAAGIMYSVPPFGYNYLSPAPPLLDQPFITTATGENNGQRFPFPFPPYSVSVQHPDASVDWANFLPLAADPFFNHNNRPAYLSNYILSIQRQLGTGKLLTVSYIGNQGHRILALSSANPGNPALCLALPGCQPFGEDNTYIDSTGKTVQGTRVGQGSSYGENTSDGSIANSNYNALQAAWRYERHGSQALLSYTYSKSIDQGSNLGEQLDPIDPRHSRAISAWDQTHDFVASFTLAVPKEAFFGHSNRLTEQWSLSGVVRFASGLPVTLFDSSDDSLLGTLGNGTNNYLLDTPEMSAGPLHINHDGRNNAPAFNKSLFSEEPIGVLGNAKRRMFYGPGIENVDLTLQKRVHLTEGSSLELRAEAFNAFNHAQFYGPAAVDGQIEDQTNFGKIVSAQSPRLLQLAVKYGF